MSSHMVFNGCDDIVKTRLETYWAKKLPRLRKLLVHYNPDLQEIRLTVNCHQKGPQRWLYQARGVIQLPTGTLAAEANDKEPQATLDRVTDALVTEIKRHKELVRHDYLYKRKGRARADLNAAGPLLQQDLSSGRREDFFRRLQPLLRFLGNHARRELHILQEEGRLHRGEVTAADLLDEVLTLAWQRFADRPPHLSLDLWLMSLVHETLERWIKEEPRLHVSLQEKADKVLPDKVPRKDEQEWWAELLGDEDTFTLEDLIPDSKAAEGWDELAAEEQRQRLLSLVGELPAAQRQAFLLYALENDDTAEIAMLQDRPESQVKADIEAARQTLRDRLLAAGHMREAGQLAAASNTTTEVQRS